MMARRITILVAVLMLLSAAQAAWSFDANSAAIGFVDGPVPGSPPGTYTSTWTVMAVPWADPVGWQPGWLLVELEFQPDGTPTSLGSSSQPAGFDPLMNPNDGWIGWYLEPSEYATYGLASTEVPGKAWTATYTVPNAINAMNYHITFARFNDSSGKWQVNQLSKTANGGEVPEPASLALLAMGLTGTVGMIRRKRGH